MQPVVGIREQKIINFLLSNTIGSRLGPGIIIVGAHGAKLWWPIAIERGNGQAHSRWLDDLDPI